MASSPSRRSKQELTAYERRLWIEVERILYQNYFSPHAVTDFWKGDRDAIITHLRQMKDRVIRAIVVLAYVEVDDVLNRAILNDALGKKAVWRKSKKYKTIQAMLDRLYPQQKLDIVKMSRNIPTHVHNHIMALNTLRNTFAHRFDLADVPRSRRLYKSKYDVFTKKGLEKFAADMWEIDEFFRPEVTKLTLELVKHQREFNKRFESQGTP